MDLTIAFIKKSQKLFPAAKGSQKVFVKIKKLFLQKLFSYPHFL